MALADIAQKAASFTLFSVSVYLTGDLLYRINKRKKERLAKLEEDEKSVRSILLVVFTFLLYIVVQKKYLIGDNQLLSTVCEPHCGMSLT